jgi:hypothetical protein
VLHDESRRAIRPFERQVLRVLGVADFLTLKTAPAAATSPGQPRGVTAEINHVLRRQPVTRHYECVSAIRVTLCDELFRSRTLAEPPFWRLELSGARLETRVSNWSFGASPGPYVDHRHWVTG